MHSQLKFGQLQAILTWARSLTSAIKACRRLACLAAVLAMCTGGPAWADSPPPPDDLGTFLGRTVACSCVAGDQSSVLAIYQAFMVSAYGETYAGQASGHMRLALREAYDNQLTICRYTCGRDLIVDLQEMIDRHLPNADTYADAAEAWEPSHSSSYYDLPSETKKEDTSFCRAQITRPECRDF